MRVVRRVLVTLGFVLAASASSQNAPNVDLVGAGTVFVDPAGYFAVRVPQDKMICKIAAQSLRCFGIDKTLGLKLTLVAKTVPETASVGIIALNRAEFYEKQSNFNHLLRKPTTIDGMPAILQSFRYDLLDNVSFGVFTESLDVLQKTKSVTLEVSCSSDALEALQASINQVFLSLHVAPLGPDGLPAKERLPRAGQGSKVSSNELSKLLKDLEQ